MKPGGVFYIREFHPFSYIFDDETEEDILRVRYPYFHSHEPMSYVSDSTYSNPDEKMESRVAYEWAHSLGDIVTSIADVGLSIEFLHEFPFTSFRQLTFMEKNQDGRWVLPEKKSSIPFMFSIRAIKKQFDLFLYYLEFIFSTLTFWTGPIAR